MSASNRLRAIDSIAVRVDQLWDITLAMSMAWYFEEIVTEESLAGVHDRLAQGILNYVVQPPKVPGARARWVRPLTETELSYSSEPIKAKDVLGWIDAQGKMPLDLLQGPTWRLSATAVEGGHTVVVLLAHHAVVDGLGMAEAWHSAVEGKSSEPQYTETDGGLGADIVDSARQYWGVVSGAARLIGSSLRGLRGKPETQPDESGSQQVLTAQDLASVPENQSVFVPRHAYLEFASEDFRNAAKKIGGTSNSLFVGIASRTLVATGVIPEGGVIRVSQQVSEDLQQRLNGNFVIEAEAIIDASSNLYDDLAPIRKASKAAFQTKPSEQLVFLADIARIIPGRLFRGKFRQMIKSPSKYLCGLSNIGKFPESFMEIDGKRARSFYPAFVMPKEQGPDWYRKFTSPIFGALSDTVGVTTLHIEGRNPDSHAIDREDFVRALLDECGRWGLTPLRVL